MTMAHVHHAPWLVAVRVLGGSSAFSVHAGGVPGRGWVGVGPAPDALAAAVTAHGLLVTMSGDPGDPRARGVVRDAVEADGTDAAVARVMARSGDATGRPGPTVWIVTADRRVGISLDGVERGTTSEVPDRSGPGTGGLRPDLAGLAATLLAPGAARSETPIPAGSTRALLGTLLEPDAAVLVLICLGTRQTAVPLRVWPGHVAGPPLGGEGDHAASLAVAAAVVDRLTATGRLDPKTVDLGLREARAGALVEAADAERQAILMAAAGDETGALVRRLVAQTHAAAVAERALLALAGRAQGASL